MSKMVKPRAALVVSLIGNDETVFVGSLHRMRLALDGLQFAGEGGDAIETGSALAVDAVEAASAAVAHDSRCALEMRRQAKANRRCSGCSIRKEAREDPGLKSTCHRTAGVAATVLQMKHET
ncbi:hypothetical protein [Rhizobium giardinii]|uniref:Uncharacterized protein n=1 Tax=Rhizobium giardinii TaxID=56731 RepID=A0A7W8UGE5_9HYPH|nr:hypothetical protein [Rhizobium giardinii]MBB5538344.1 hypothetical protein [Rhizobium giardinii]